jgi:hypothetical protein
LESKTVTGLTPSTTYYFAIKTSDEVPNTSAISNVPSTTTQPLPDTTAPAAISSLGVLSRTGSTVTLSWTAPGDDGNVGTATTYDIRYSTTTITEANWSTRTQVIGEPAPQVAGSSQNMTVTGLNSDTTYFFAIKTLDEVPNTSALSNVVATSTLDITAPAAVSNLSISTTTQTSATLTWTAPGDDNNTGTATSYDIRYSTSVITEGNWASATQVVGEPTPLVAGSAQNMSVSGLTPNTTYFFAIKTSDEVPNISAISNIPSANTQPTPDTTAPAAVSNLSVTSRTGTSISVSWTAPGDDNNTGTATSYDIRYSTSVITEGNWASATQVVGEPTPLVAGSAQSFTVTGLSNQTTYFIALKTSDEVPNISALSNVVSTSTLDIVAPSAISNLAISTTTQTSATLTWTAPGDDNNTGTATSYDIRYSTTTITEANWATRTQVSGEPIPLIAGSSQSFTVTGLSQNTTYFFAIKTSDEVPNISALSNVPSALTQSTNESLLLSVNTASIGLSNVNKDITGITLTNLSTSTSITVAQMTISWTGGTSGSQLSQIRINSVTVFNTNINSGALADITDVIIPAGTTYTVNWLRFTKAMSGSTLSITFTMIDGSTKIISGLTP